MQMNQPAHPGELIQDNLQELSLSVAVAAKALGVTRQQLYNVINGKSGVTSEMAMRLAAAFGGNAEFWLKMQMAYDISVTRTRVGDLNIQRLSSITP